MHKLLFHRSPVCTTTPEKVDDIATDMYNRFCDLGERQVISNSIRENVDKESTHHLIAYPEMIKVGS